jgi:hypothetical protein
MPRFPLTDDQADAVGWQPDGKCEDVDADIFSCRSSSKAVPSRRLDIRRLLTVLKEALTSQPRLSSTLAAASASC